MNRKILFLFCVLSVFLFSFVAFALNPQVSVKFDPKKFDYELGDYLQVNWDIIDWKKIPPLRIQDVPADKIVYEKLNPEQKKELTAKQIELNLDEITDLYAHVRPERAIDAVNKKYGVQLISLEASVSAMYGELYNYNNGYRIKLTNENYKKGTLSVTKEGEIIFVPYGKPRELSFSPADTDHVKIDSSAFPIDFKDNSFKGVFIYDYGVVYTAGEGQPLEVSGVEIISKDRVGIDTKGMDLEKIQNRHMRYISLNKKKGEMWISNTGSEPLSISFKEGNPFFKLSAGERNLAGDIWIKREDRLEFTVFDGAKAFFKKDGGSLITPSIPIVKVQGKVGIINGNNDYSADKGKFELKVSESIPAKLSDWQLTKKIEETPGFLKTYREHTSVPFELRLENDEGENIFLSEWEPQKIIFDNSQNFVVIPEKQGWGKECRRCTEDLTNFVKGRMKEGIIDIRTTGDWEESALDMAVVKQNLERLSPEMREAVAQAGRITIVPDERIAEYCEAVNAGGCASASGIVISKSNARSFSLLQHEAAHTLHFILIAKGESGGGVSPPYGMYLGEKGVIRPGFFTSTVGEKTEWADGTDVPIYPCISAYACNNRYEHVAESAGKYSRYKELVDLSSNFYKERMGKQVMDLEAKKAEPMTAERAKKWAEGFKDQLEYIYTKKFITEEQYCEVVECKPGVFREQRIYARRRI